MSKSTFLDRIPHKKTRVQHVYFGQTDHKKVIKNQIETIIKEKELYENKLIDFHDWLGLTCNQDKTFNNGWQWDKKKPHPAAT